MRQRLGQLWQTRFALSDPTETLQQRIAGMLRRAVLERAIPLDAPLPSTRELASELGVARATVAIAYERLQIEGAIESRERRGFSRNGWSSTGTCLMPRRWAFCTA